MNFDSREEFDELGKKAYLESVKKGKAPVLNNPQKINTLKLKNFFGTDDTIAMDVGKFLTYIDKPLLDRVVDEFDLLFSTIDMGGAFNKKRLITTDNQSGIFDFGLAAQGLYRKQEYFSQELANESPSEFFDKPSGVVPVDLVREDKLGNFWYTSEVTNIEYLLTKQQEGTRAVELKLKDAKLIYGTTNKKSYMMFERQGGKQRMVDLYVPQGGMRDLTKEGMLARALPLLLAAKYFELAGIRTRINVCRMFERDKNVICATFPIKNYGDELDFNWIAINCSDPRFFRWNMWKYVSGLLADRYGLYMQGHGNTVYSGDLFLETANRYKNWYFDRVDKGLEKELQIDRPLMLFTGLPDPSNSIKASYNKIKNEFYKILDVVDFQYNQSEKSAKRIYTRMVENDGKSTHEFKSYVQKIMSESFSYAKYGDYATPMKQQDILEEKYDSAMDGIDNFLHSIR